MVLNLSSPFFNFLSCVLMSTIEIVTSGKKKFTSEFRSYSSEVLSDVHPFIYVFSYWWRTVVFKVGVVSKGSFTHISWNWHCLSNTITSYWVEASTFVVTDHTVWIPISHMVGGRLSSISSATSGMLSSSPWAPEELGSSCKTVSRV